MDDASAPVLAMPAAPTLIVLGGLPGTGKTTIARELAARLPCVYVRIDAIEQALKALNPREEIGAQGYVVGYEIARSNLALGMTVIADCVNPLNITRQAWRGVAASTASGVLEVEVVCADPAEHRRRVEGRTADIPGHTLPSWSAVCANAYEPWSTPHLVIDSARLSADEAAVQLLQMAQRLALMRRGTA